MNFVVETEIEGDGRWLAEVVELPGALAYGVNRQAAVANVEALVLRILADRLENGDAVPEMRDVFSVAA